MKNKFIVILILTIENFTFHKKIYVFYYILSSNKGIFV